MNTPGRLPIEDHGIIGDRRTVVLVGLDASIDFPQAFTHQALISTAHALDRML